MKTIDVSWDAPAGMDEYLQATHLVDLGSPAVREATARLRERRDPVVRKYLDLEFPHTPPSLQAVIAMSLLDMGYEARGPWWRKRFYRPAAIQPRRKLAFR
jgi:hypothetical protein